MPEIVRFVVDPLVARQVVRLLLVLASGVPPHLATPGRRSGHAARPELEHPVLFLLRCDGLLGLHGCQLQENVMLSSTFAVPITDNVCRRRGRMI
jgi:hypothetical protein